MSNVNSNSAASLLSSVPEGDLHAIRIRVRGLVQGVGFRPFIYRIAVQYGIHGSVENANDAVYIHAEASKAALEAFRTAIWEEKPPASEIHELNSESTSLSGATSFTIIASTDRSNEVTQVSPDIAVCRDCLADLKTQTHRIDYPLINCTNCGPRFSIIRALPYDRPQTTMDVFPMCPTCRNEYEDVLDRRFHAQPVACNACGPRYWISTTSSAEAASPPSSAPNTQPVARCAELIDGGALIALKGTGGYHLVCDAHNEQAVQQLRAAKRREGKPFAVMFRDIETLKSYSAIGKAEQDLLESPARPIVLLQRHHGIAPSVSNGLAALGAILPSMPFHYLLFEQLTTDAVVLTSGNVTDEPIVIEDEAAWSRLGPRVDAVVSYDRAIHNRVDDSVMMVVRNTCRPIRRSRGYAPAPIPLNMNTEGVIAVGAELKNTFALGKGNDAILSQHIGDLKNAETLEFFEEAVERFSRLFRFEPQVVACDLHPDYLSTRFAESLGLPLLKVQHHHAHIVAGMAEHGLNNKVIGVSFDGTGYGSDETIWGGEFMIADRADFHRAAHMPLLALPGGDRVVSEPWRSAVALLYREYGDGAFSMELPFLQSIPEQERNAVQMSLQKNIFCPPSSSAGRLFDAVAALLGVCTHAAFDAEGPMRLEALAAPGVSSSYPFTIVEAGSETPSGVEARYGINMHDTIAALLEEARSSQDLQLISSRFHTTICRLITEMVDRLRASSGINDVVLSGGLFQNRYILERTEFSLAEMGFSVYAHRQVPTNDGGISLGQLAAAAARRDICV